MNKLGFFLILCELLLVCLLDEVLTKPSGSNIRGGEDAKDGEFPYMVEIRADGCFICGGSIIGPKWILTAGHCVIDRGVYSIVYGTKVLQDCHDNVDDPDTVIYVKALYQHSSWSLNGGVPSNDIALIELEKDIPFNTYVQPLILAEEAAEPPLQELGNLTGWGSAVSGENPIVNLQKIKLPVLANEDCCSRIDNVIDEVAFNGTQFFCTDDQDNGQCNGDSGSPFVINGIQYGIASWSIKPCGLYPGVYSRVAWSEHRQWIKDVSGI